jgi:hypothetical protein
MTVDFYYFPLHLPNMAMGIDRILEFLGEPGWTISTLTGPPLTIPHGDVGIHSEDSSAMLFHYPIPEHSLRTRAIYHSVVPKAAVIRSSFSLFECRASMVWLLSPMPVRF